jgi:hypothetical protein
MSITFAVFQTKVETAKRKSEIVNLYYVQQPTAREKGNHIRCAG